MLSRACLFDYQENIRSTLEDTLDNNVKAFCNPQFQPIPPIVIMIHMWSRNIIIFTNGSPLIPIPIISEEVIIAIFLQSHIISIHKYTILHITISNIVTQEIIFTIIIIFYITGYRIFSRSIAVIV